MSFGAAGITYLSHFQNLSSIFIILPNDGVNKGVIKYLSKQSLANQEKTNIFYSGLFLSVLLFLGTALFFFLFKGFFPNPFPGTENSWIFLSVFLFGLQVLNYYFLSVILAMKNLPGYVLIHLLGNFLSLVLVVYFSFYSDYQTALIGWATGPAITSIVSIGFLYRYGFISEIRGRISKGLKSIKNLGDYILVALSILIFSKITDFGIREFAILEYNPEETGYWQAVVRVSDFYIMAFLAFLNMVYYPRASELSEDKAKLNPFARKFFFRIILILLVGLSAVYLLREQVLVLFFNQEFIRAESFFPFQLLGDFLKMHAWVLSFLLLAQARTKLFIISQGVFAGIYLVSAYYFTSQEGISGLPMAHFCRYLLYWFFLVIVYKELFLNTD